MPIRCIKEEEVKHFIINLEKLPKLPDVSSF